jgi:DNA helicase-2/ATP-dependent DNA helicase PcrA
MRAGRSAIDVLDDLREVIKGFGVRRPGRLPAAAKEAQRIAQIEALGDRLKQESVIPGLTVFQAKGREWSRVGVVLTRTQEALLAAGLQALDDENCVIYVALTRAKNRCVRLGSGTAPQLEIEEPPGG